MNIAVPTKRSLAFQSGSDLLKTGGGDEGLDLPDWTKPLLNLSHFLHFLRGDASLPENLLNEVF